jgi:hypothetical protein
MRSHLILFVVVLFPAMVFTSCLSGYKPLDRDTEHAGKPITEIHLEGATIRIAIEEQNTGNVSVTLAVLDLSKERPVKLSNVKIFLAGMPGTYVLKQIDFTHMAGTGYVHLLKTNARPVITEGSDFNLSEEGRYIITYYFSGGKTIHYPKKLTAELGFSLAAAKGSQDFHESIVFRKYRSLSLFH